MRYSMMLPFDPGLYCGTMIFTFDDVIIGDFMPSIL